MIALPLADPRYPAGLRELHAPPDPLWVAGDLGVLAVRAIAIVGTRRMTGYGERVARELAMACAAAGLVVVSGLAQGIDSAAHRGALDGGGRTVAVLGESIPSFVATVGGRRRQLAPRIRARGALVSEFRAPLGAQPWTYAKRNATIAALALAVVVVEAGETSGALITARDAAGLGRPLYAVPGPLGSTASAGTNALIAAGRARALVSADQLVRGSAYREAAREATRDATRDAAREPTRDAAREPTDRLGDALRDGPLGIDELAWRLRTSSREVAARIAERLVRGEIVALPDGRVRRR